MKKSIEILEDISTKCLNHQTVFKYGKYLSQSDKYKSGRVTAASWINELIYYFIKKERHILIEFKEQIAQQKSTILNLKEGDYKQGLLDELCCIEDMLNDRINSK